MYYTCRKEYKYFEMIETQVSYDSFEKCVILQQGLFQKSQNHVG